MKRFISLICAFALVISCFCFTVFADSNGNTYIDVNDYAEYDLTGDIVTASLELPAEWTKTAIFEGFRHLSFGAPDNIFTGKSFETTINSEDDLFSVCIYPLSGYVSMGLNAGDVVKDKKILDISCLPKTTEYHYSVYMEIDDATVYDESGIALYEYILYLDLDGNIISTTKGNLFNMGVLGYSKTGVKFTWDGYFTLEDVPGAVAIIPFFSIRNISTYYESNSAVRFTYDNLAISFDLNELQYESIQNEKMQNTLDKVNEGIDNAVNGSYDSQKPADSDKFDELDKTEDELLGNVDNYLNEGIGFFDNAVGAIFKFANGFQAIKVLMAPVFNLPLFGDIILVSVSLGLIGTILGVVAFATRSIGKNDKPPKSSGKGKG